MDYLTLLLNTNINQKAIFSEVIQNRQKEIDKEKSISKKEFYFNCSKVIETLKSQIDDKFNKRKNELYLIINLKEAKSEPITNIQNELNTIHKNQFPINLLHLTGDKFRGNLFLNDIDFIEKCINELQYISDKQKDELFKNTTFFYTSTHFNKSNLKGVFNKDCETKDDFIKILYSENTRIFFRYAITLKNEDFVNSINNEFKLFCAYNNVTNEIKENWLLQTYQFIININELSGFIDKPTVCLFVNWYNETLKNLTNEKTNKEAKDYKEYPWFKIGLKLATGEAFELYHKYKLDKGHFVKLCLELGFKKTERPYFSKTINDSKKRITDKNIFANKDKLQKLHKHLTENNLPFGTKFLEKYNQIETE